MSWQSMAQGGRMHRLGTVLAAPLTHAADALIFAAACCVALLCRRLPRFANIWLICERANQARDNGFHLFRYIRTHHPLCRAYYVIGGDAVDRDAVAALGPVVRHRSFRHHLFYLLASKLICSHKSGLVPHAAVFRRAVDYVFPRKVYYLKHGIIKEYLPGHTYRESRLALVVCGAKPEYDYISAMFGFPEGVVQYLGLCRFDALHGVTTNRKQILLMPTWRLWFGMASKRTHARSPEIRQSDYVVAYNNLINDPRLLTMLHAHNLKMVFFLHHQMQDFVGEFSSPSGDLVVAQENEYREQQLLMESALLITDYSSVAFDFAYMGKPLIYYQFDEERYYAEHYARGYFDYVRDGFGPVAQTHDDVIGLIRTAIENEFAEPPCYEERVRRCFPVRDTGNCRRNYQAILTQ